MRYRGSIAKWLFLVAGLMLTMDALKTNFTARSTVSAGFLIAFAVLHAGDRMAKRLDSRPPAGPSDSGIDK